MKISQEGRIFSETKKSEKKHVSNTSQKFGDMLTHYKEPLSSKRLDKLLTEIEKQGKRLITSQTMKDLYYYKRLIQDFVKEAVDYGMQLTHNKSWNSHGQAQKYSIVKKVDEQLLALTEEMLRSEKKQVDILNRIGEINGLLINIYT